VIPASSRRPEELPPPILVEDEHGLARLLEDLEGTTEIAVDTEADSFYRYRERVCLIQITANERDYLLDPLQGLDLRPLGAVFSDPRRTKVFHDGEYDILILKREYGFDFAGLFDTRIAVAALGSAALGLAAVVQSRFGVELDKSEQRSDWSRRPLSPSQIDYARLDTHYLLALRRVLAAELEGLGRSRILEGECRRLERLAAPERVFDPDDFLRIKGARSLGPLELRVLRELFVWRDAEACERDVPPFKVLGNDTLLLLARRPPRSLRHLEGVPGLSPRAVRRIGGKILTVVARAEELGSLARPRPAPRDGTGGFDDAAIELHERLKDWRKERGAEHGIDSSLVLNRHALLRLARTRPKTLEALRQVEGLVDWQIELFGAGLLDLLARFEADLAAGKLDPARRRGRRREAPEDAD